MNEGREPLRLPSLAEWRRFEAFPDPASADLVLDLQEQRPEPLPERLFESLAEQARDPAVARHLAEPSRLRRILALLAREIAEPEPVSALGPLIATSSALGRVLDRIGPPAAPALRELLAGPPLPVYHERFAGSSVLYQRQAGALAVQLLERHGDLTDVPLFRHLLEDPAQPPVVRLTAGLAALRRGADTAGSVVELLVDPTLEASDLVYFLTLLDPYRQYLAFAAVAKFGAGPAATRRRCAQVLEALRQPMVRPLIALLEQVDEPDVIALGEPLVAHFAGTRILRRIARRRARMISRARPRATADPTRGLSRADNGPESRDGPR